MVGMRRTDVRFVKGGVARATRTLRAAATPGPPSAAKKNDESGS